MTLLPKISAKTTLTALFSILIVGTGLIMAITPVKTPAATTTYPNPKTSQTSMPSPSAPISPAPSATSSAAVAGSATTAPQPSASQPSAHSSANLPVTTAPKITLTLMNGASNTSFQVTLIAGANACTILYEAQKEGRINSVSISDKYSYLHSLFVESINGIPNWNYAINSPQNSPPYGCSNPQAPPLVPDEKIFWIHT